MKLPQIQRREVQQLPQWEGIPPLLARILAGRGIISPDELPLGLDKLPAPTLMPAIDQAVALLLEARQQQSRILVIGDYDADGATATALMLRGLALLGYPTPGFLVPDRFEYGYGLSPEIVELARREADPQLIITVDNGIASVEGVAAARAAGIKVLITDHHLPGAQLPDANAIVNPRLTNDPLLHNLAGVGVAFYVLLALRKALRESPQPIKEGEQPGGEANLANLLDLVALGTFADVVSLDRTNRILVEQGVRRIRAGKCSPGITALLKLGNREPSRISAQDLGFVIGPRLNAAGRLADMSSGIDCLLCDDPVRAQQMAEDLDSINRERRTIEQGMRDAAMHEVERLLQRGDLPFGLCLHDDGWHEGVVGILASRVKEATHRPVIAFAPAQEKGMLKGSGRSIPGLHLRDALDAIATRNPGMLNKFGGHAMAAGLSLKKEHLGDFTAAFNQIVTELAPPEIFNPVIDTDGNLEDSDITLANAEMLNHAYPWGQNFPAPKFDGEFEVLSHRIVGERHLKLTLGLPGTRGIIDAIHFNIDVPKWPGKIKRVSGIYRLDVNEFRGQRNAQLLFEHLVPL